MRDCSSEPQVSRCSAPPSSFVIHTHTNKGRQEVEEDDRPTDRLLISWDCLFFFLSPTHPIPVLHLSSPKKKRMKRLRAWASVWAVTTAPSPKKTKRNVGNKNNPKNKVITAERRGERRPIPGSAQTNHGTHKGRRTCVRDDDAVPQNLIIILHHHHHHLRPCGGGRVESERS